MLFKGMLRHHSFSMDQSRIFLHRIEGFKILYNKIRMYRFNFLNHNLSKKNHPQNLISRNQNSSARSFFVMAIKQTSGGKGSMGNGKHLRRIKLYLLCKSRMLMPPNKYFIQVPLLTRLVTLLYLLP